MECLSIPLYLENSSIASGPKNGASFAAYIPSSVADLLINYGLFNSFDDILQSDATFSTVFNDSLYSFSINNIYLNNQTINWNREDDLKNNSFCNHFAKWNKDAIFSYCPKLIRLDEQVLLSSDIREGYGNLDYLSKAAISNASKDVFITLYQNINNKTFVSPPFSKTSLLSTFNINQILLLTTLVLLFLSIVIFSFFVSYIFRLKKILFLIAISIFFVLFVSEVVKTIASLNILIYSIFNPFGNTLLLLVAVLLTCSLLFRGKHEKAVENNFYSISI